MSITTESGSRVSESTCSSNGKIIVEVKASATLPAGAERQVFNYPRATDLEVGLLLHYGPKPAFKRYICTNDRKNGRDLYQGTATSFRRASRDDPPDNPK